MVSNLRTLSIKAINSTSIEALFTASLNPDITTDNITVTSETPGVTSPRVLNVKIVSSKLVITVQPLTNLAVYYVIFASTENVIFDSLNGDALLLEDGIANKQFLLGPLEDTNAVKEYFINYLKDNVYNTEDGTVINNYLNSLSTILSKALYDSKQVRNENYLSTTIVDERKTRGATPFDRLDNEGAYDIIRVARTESNTISTKKISIDAVSTDPISLLQSIFSENLIINSTDIIGYFNINTFVLNLSKRFVTKVNSIIFTYTDGHLPFTYDIDSLGYQILDSKYNRSVSFNYQQLLDNQIKLNDKILENVNFSSNAIFQIEVSYEYKDTGRILDSSTISATTVLSSGREVLPPLRNIFNLKHAPIVTIDDKIGSVGDIQFVNQNVLSIFNAIHPAFITEINFRLDFLPSSPGEYAIDYDTGTVYVFGSDHLNEGTGSIPPLAIYNYRLNFKENVDWIFDDTVNDLVALANGNLIDSPAKISFKYEKVLAKDIDYKANIHKETLIERIGNNLVALNALTVENAPLTNVFRIFNESSGEIYNVVRWYNNKIYFTYVTPPNISEIKSERATFQSVDNEVLFVNNTIEISPTLKIFKILLNNNQIMAQSEDCIGSSFNSTVSTSNGNIFVTELYFDNAIDESINLSRLDVIGKYIINYVDGIVYVVVEISQGFDIGTISYKRGYINPKYPHVTSIADIYYRINTLSAKDRNFEYISFDDGFILPTTLASSSEQFLTDNISYPYIVSSNQIGAFVDTIFVNSVTDRIQFIRGIYENEDLLNNISPINFSITSSFDNKSISISPIELKEYHNVEFDGVNYFILLNTALYYSSSNISLNIEVIRLTDDVDLWDGSGSIVTGSSLKLILSGINTPQIGDSVLVTYNYSINDLSHVVVDYNKGEYYIDYNALVDEIIVSYEYGDNSIDFRETSAIDAGENYFVTYKAGALRDALLKNFGSLIDIDILNTFDVTFDRERYRDALMAAMHSFSQGPTVKAIKTLVETITHIPAEVNEYAFEGWSLGSSLLYPNEFKTTGDFELSLGKYNDGLMIDRIDQTVTLPVLSNFKLESGTFEAWIKPNWNGLDNLSQIKVYPIKDGYVLSDLEIFIGALEYHPILEIDYATGKQFFTLNKSDRVAGTPNKNKDGMYLYYDKDVTGLFDRWFIEIIDGYANDGYIDGYVSKRYSVNIVTDGKFYDVKSMTLPQPGSSKITSGTNNLLFAVNSVNPNNGITFVADTPHYILDIGEYENKNRFSIFKDESGYLNFKVFDKLKNSYTVSADVSAWRHGDLHHVATSWKINTVIGRDELHLFIDGIEVPNIIKYGSRTNPYLHENFRTVNPEEIVGVIDRNIISGNDIITSIGSTLVTSSINFSQYDINISDTMYIEESGFDDNGYSIVNVNGNILTLSSSMPLSITDGKFSINKIDININSEIDIFPNFVVSLLHAFITEDDLSTTNNSSVVTSVSTNFIDDGVEIGDLIRINNDLFENHYVILSVDNNSLELNADMPDTDSNLSYNIYHTTEEEIPGVRALHPAYEISKSTDGYNTNILTLRDKALVDDLVLIKTLGLNHRKVHHSYYVWGDQSNILRTKIPSPISLDEVSIIKILLINQAIGPDNSTLVLGEFNSDDILTDQPSNSATGRTLSISIKGDNIDFITPTTVILSGDIIDNTGTVTTTTETLVFDKAGKQNTVNLFIHIDHVNVNCTPLIDTKNSAIIEIKELYSMVEAENTIFIANSPDIISQPIIRYSYQVVVGNSLYCDGDTTDDGYIVKDDNKFFSDSLINNYLIIYSPMSVVGSYKIVDIIEEHHGLVVTSDAYAVPLLSFTDGYYQILNPTDYRSGLQNGYFTFEDKIFPGDPYVIEHGWYELEYYTYASIPFDVGINNMYLGSNFNGEEQLYGLLDDVQILNVKLTDTRIGETTPNTQRTITKDFNSVKEVKHDVTTLVLANLDTIPPVNSAEVYKFSDYRIIQAGEVINDNFNQSIRFTDKPLIIDNDGILNTKKEATIEFWINPLFDSLNDPNYRFYFDINGAVSEANVSSHNTIIDLVGTAANIISVKLISDDVNYFAGGELTNGGKTLLLHKPLPNQNTNVIVTYIPKGLKGDRISIYKDPFGYLNFNIRANSLDYQVRAPVFWTRNSWHRIKATYKVNSGNTSDEIHLLIDGYEKGNLLFGTDLLFGNGTVFGSSFAGITNNKYNIKFNDPINHIYIGSDSNSNYTAYCLMDNIRISNIARPIYQPFGEPIDPNYSSNLDMVFPITEDLNTTLLLNFNALTSKNTDFALLNNNSNLADFSVNIYDSLDIVSSSLKVKEVLETLIKSFKPATSRAFIKYN